jgi:hypothetical protein
LFGVRNGGSEKFGSVQDFVRPRPFIGLLSMNLIHGPQLERDQEAFIFLFARRELEPVSEIPFHLTGVVGLISESLLWRPTERTPHRIRRLRLSRVFSQDLRLRGFQPGSFGHCDLISD